MADLTAQFVGSIPEYYDAHVGRTLFDPYAADLARRVVVQLDSQPAGRILETACGTGILTRRLRGLLPPRVQLVATDLNASMLDYARRKLGEGPAIEWREADASALPFPAASFSAVICAFGVMFVPDKSLAFREARRVLADGGLFAFNVWDGVEENPHARATSTVFQELFPGDPVADFTRVPFGFNDQAQIRAMLSESGFGAIGIEQVRIAIESPSAKFFAIGAIRGTPRSLMLQQRGVEIDGVVDKVAEAFARLGGSEPFRSHAQALVVTARAA